ncbi:MAG: hypothetical protein ACI9U2_005241 [Bradymonadia bacterium]|jgi:hypothetical protein
MPRTAFDPPPTPWDADDGSLFAPVGRFSSMLNRLNGWLPWRRRWTP